LFFGRTQAIQELVNLVDDHPPTAVVGVSGAGKTTLLQAGPRPHSQTRGWQVPDPIRPGAMPLHSLVTALQQTVGSPGRDVATLLTDWFRAHPQQRLLLIIDPLEELIIECHDERQRADFQRVL